MPSHTAIPMPVRELAARVQRLRVSHVTSWEALAHQRGPDPADEAKRIASRKIAADFAEAMRSRGTWRTHQEAGGEVVTVEAYCLTYDQLVELMTDAFNAGHKAARTGPMEMGR